MNNVLAEMKSALLVLTYLSIPMSDEERLTNFMDIIEKQSGRIKVKPKALIKQYERLSDEMYDSKNTEFFKHAQRRVKDLHGTW